MKRIIDWLFEVFVLTPLTWWAEWYAQKYIGEQYDGDDEEF